MAEEAQPGRGKKAADQRDAQQKLQEPLGSREALTGKLALNGEVNNWEALGRGTP